jgi:hypothetical protein
MLVTILAIGDVVNAVAESPAELAACTLGDISTKRCAFRTGCRACPYFVGISTPVPRRNDESLYTHVALGFLFYHR